MFKYLSNLLKLLKNPQRLICAVKFACRVTGNSFARYKLPEGKITIPPAIKSNVFPVPVVICGTLVDGRPNFNTLGNFGLISPTRPNPIVYISSCKKHFTNIGIRKSGYFSVNIPSRNIIAQADYLGVVSGHKTDKSNILTVFYGRYGNIPLLAECPLNYICKVIRHIEIRDKDLFIGEIVESFISAEYLKNNKIDIEGLEPLIYTADNNYRVPSTPVGKAYKEYQFLKKQEKIN